jgi:hypothetical protein
MVDGEGSGQGEEKDNAEVQRTRRLAEKDGQEDSRGRRGMAG